jgi:hypothetical protein
VKLFIETKLLIEMSKLLKEVMILLHQQKMTQEHKMMRGIRAESQLEERAEKKVLHRFQKKSLLGHNY